MKTITVRGIDSILSEKLKQAAKAALYPQISFTKY